MPWVRAYVAGAVLVTPFRRNAECPWFLSRLATLFLTLMLCASAFVSEPTAAQTSCNYANNYICPDFALPAGSPPATCIYPALTGTSPSNNINQVDYFTLNSVTSTDPHVTVTSVVQPTPTTYGYATLILDTTGLPAGCYTTAIHVIQTNVIVTINPSRTSVSVVSTDPTVQVNINTNTAVTLLDPVPDLISGNAVKTNTQLQSLLTKGRPVQGVAADGVTQLLIRIDTTNPSHQFAITLADDQGLSGSNIIPNEDGSLDVPGGTSFSFGQLTVSSGSLDSSGMAHAFAVYRAAIDFARPSGSGFKSGTCKGVTKTDDQLACRAVSLQIQDVTANTSLPTTTITIVRPPVFLIHGLWGEWKAWNNFSPLVTGKNSVDARFHVERVSYDWDVGSQISSSNPHYTASMNSAKANSLGVQYVTPFVLTQIAKAIAKFKAADNPVALPVADVQADIIAHSMGGVVTRTLPLQAGFLSSTLGQGIIHKVISVDVPHLGSPLAALLLDPTADCTREILASGGNFSFRSINLGNAPNTPVSGAVGDMLNSPLSPALTAISNSGPHPLPTALIAGVYTNFTSLDCTTTLGFPCPAYYIRSTCGQGDVMASKFNSTGWPLIFGPTGNNNNDGVVSQSSQLNGLTINSGTNGFIYNGLVHSPGLTKLSFTGPSVLDPASSPNPAANQIITLLNTPYTQPAFQSLNP